VTRPIAFEGFRGEAAEAFAVADPAAEARRLLDPAVATRTLHWGRNYLYAARVDGVAGTFDVVVKQFRESGRRDRWRRRSRGSKGERSWRVARALAAAGISTPEPLVWVAAEASGGPSLFVTRLLADRVEARYLLRARNAGRDEAEFPQIAFDAFLAAAAALARRLHDAGFWHRDYSAGNLLLLPGERPAELADVALVDLNRCRAGRRVGLGERMRDLARLPLERAEDRRRLLAAYFGAAGVPASARLLYDAARVGFHGRHRLKRRLRGAGAKLRSWLVPRGTHAHIPPPPEGATARDKIVWDRLSDQPHSHAGRLERAKIRLDDLGDHAASAGALAGSLRRVWRRYRELAAAPREPFTWPGVGVALRPWADDPEAQLAAFDALGIAQALVRLHPWQESHDEEEELARALAGRGVEITFSLPQSRELVRDPRRWRAAVEQIAERFLPYGRRFQLGQAINRSKWGVWSYGEYVELAAAAAEILRARGAVDLAGPAVIDFEAHVTAAVVNRHHPTLGFDALASLLYVDRRGAPENRQLGFDTVDKVTLLAAIAETGRRIGRRRQWITEVNWPLAEGPHSPAGRAVAVNEAVQADYLARFYLLALGSGLVERVFWWQLVARGYGLVDPGSDGTLRRRPAFDAMATLARMLPAGATCHGLERRRPDAWSLRFTLAGGGERIAAWAPDGGATLELAAEPAAVAARDGRPLPPGRRIELGPGVRYVTP